MLVPVGIVMLAFPLLLVVTSPTVAVGALAAAIGVFLIYKGLGIDAYLSRLPSQTREALYSGQVSLVTYVVAAGLSLVGVFAGVLGVSAVGDIVPSCLRPLCLRVRPVADRRGTAASLGRLLDELIQQRGSGARREPSVRCGRGRARRSRPSASSSNAVA